MRRTSEQQQQIEAAMAAGKRRIVTRFTPEQAEEWRTAVAEEEAARPETIKALRRRQQAAQEPGIFGDLRRAITTRLLDEHRRGRPTSTEPLGIDARRLEDFREGIASLSADDLRQLIDTLGLQLMQPIPQVRQPQDAPREPIDL